MSISEKLVRNDKRRTDSLELSKLIKTRALLPAPEEAIAKPNMTIKSTCSVPLEFSCYAYPGGVGGPRFVGCNNELVQMFSLLLKCICEYKNVQNRCAVCKS